ncbi:hypothetical protein BD779DRAFT_1532378 [Infundibulicybe gibba]|nr:hypothetical protein BD779DRAFT_1532378 [Infundibulicybe gibba]
MTYTVRLDEIDPYKKPKDLLEISPKGLVPALKLYRCSPSRRSMRVPSSWTISKNARALIRLQSDFVNRNIVPAFYRYIQAQDADSQVRYGKEFRQTLEGLVALLERAENEVANVGEADIGVGLGLWLKNGELGWTDVMVGPWLYRAANVLKHYRGFEMPAEKKFSEWIERLFNHPAFKATCSTDDVYIESYERYAFNRPNTSQTADAINSGRNLP